MLRCTAAPLPLQNASAFTLGDTFYLPQATADSGCPATLEWEVVSAPLIADHTLSGVLGESARDKIEVIQFFYYGCPHCFDMQPILDDWLAKKPA